MWLPWCHVMLSLGYICFVIENVIYMVTSLPNVLAIYGFALTLLWRHNDRVSNHQPHDCLLNRLLRRRLKKTSNLRVAGLCAGNSPGTGEFPAQMVSNAENVSIWWRHHEVRFSVVAILSESVRAVHNRFVSSDAGAVTWICCQTLIELGFQF